MIVFSIVKNSIDFFHNIPACWTEPGRCIFSVGVHLNLYPLEQYLITPPTPKLLFRPVSFDFLETKISCLEVYYIGYEQTWTFINVHTRLTTITSIVREHLFIVRCHWMLNHVLLYPFSIQNCIANKIQK